MPADGLPELRADGHRGADAVCNLLTLPLRHGRNHREEQPPGGRRSIDAFGETDHVGVARPEHVGEVEKLLRVARQSRELGEHEAGDCARPDVRQHAAGLWVRHDGFPAHGIKAVHLGDMPALEHRVCAGPLLVMFGAFATHLVFG